MGFNYFTVHGTAPELDPHLRRANEARAAAVYATWTAVGRAVSAAVRRLIEALGRSRRARRTYRELRALSDSQLRDIGLHRAEIADVAEVVAAEGSGFGVTLADLRRIGALDSAEPGRPAAALPEVDRPPRRPAPWAAKRRTATTPRHERTAA